MLLCDLISRSKLLELSQGFGLVTPDPFSSRELGGVWARDYSEVILEFVLSYAYSSLIGLLCLTLLPTPLHSELWLPVAPAMSHCPDITMLLLLWTISYMCGVGRLGLCQRRSHER